MNVPMMLVFKQNSIGMQPEHPTTRLFDLEHSDLLEWDVRSKGGAKYVLTFLKDYSSACWIVLLKTNFEAIMQYQHFVQMIQTQFGTTIKAIQTHMGTEFVNERLGSFLSNNGIIHRTTRPNKLQ